MAAPLGNAFLDNLPPALAAGLRRHMELVALPIRTPLYSPEERPRYVHFITSGLASIVMELQTGQTAEVVTIGHEGVVQAIHLLGPGIVLTRGFMQVGGTGLRMPFATFQKLFDENSQVRAGILRNVQYQTAFVSQIAACNRLHQVEARLARWLLMVEDRIESDVLPLTQEFLAEMLGSRRSTVTEVAGVLQRAGLIKYSRGKVRILDRKGLEAASCVCYAASARLLDDIYR
jgi:CRP-like cAMP-binding protein